MYPSYNNCNFNSIPFFFDNDINSISKDDHSFGFPNSPSMRYEYEAASHQFHDLFHDQHNSLATDVPAQINVEYSCKAAAKDLLKEVCYSKTSQQIPRKRSSNKDRHSKINTAHGPRDRRMRLSLDVAHKFFGLQDMLGFDKASKTVDWLLKNSRSAIRELMQGPCIYKRTCSLSSTSECEVVSGIDDQSAVYENKSTKKSELDKPSSAKERKKKKSKVERTTVAKESRRKARERARARTSEKNSLRESERKTANNHGSIRFRNCQLETGEESVNRSSNMNPSYEILAEVEQLSSCGVQILGGRDEDNWNASTILNYPPGAANSSHEPQFTDLMFCTKPWEAYSSFNLSG